MGQLLYEDMTWAPSEAMSAKTESETLMNAMLPLAEQMLRRGGEFHPYGGYMKPDGIIVDVGAEDTDTDRPKSKDLIYLLRSSFHEMVDKGQCKAVALIFNVVVNLPDSDRKSDAIQVCVDHAEGYSAEVFFPYRVVNDKVIYGQVFAQEGKYEFFA
jgi:hypothetical protein